VSHRVTQGVAEQNCSPHGCWEAKRDRKGPRQDALFEDTPRDLLPPAGPRLLTQAFGDNSCANHGDIALNVGPNLGVEASDGTWEGKLREREDIWAQGMTGPSHGTGASAEPVSCSPACSRSL
jgi:hypothetical protein